MTGGNPGAPSRLGYLVEFDAGETIFEQGERGAEMYIIREGRVRIARGSGEAEQELAVLEKGDFFGEMSLLESLPRSAAARALTTVQAVRIDAATFDQMLRSNPEIAVRIMRKLSRRLRETDALVHETEESAAGEGRQAAGSGRSLVGCRLVHRDSGREFALPSVSEVTVGRLDPVTGILPEVDLTPIDFERSSSRRHARIRRQGEGYGLEEEIGTTNGTFVNGERIRKGAPVEIRSGDALRFGLVELIVHAG